YAIHRPYHGWYKKQRKSEYRIYDTMNG
ncbi:hypothetical protein D030_1986B, partial [Vibrio parahaemolyticus AQ3810]